MPQVGDHLIGNVYARYDWEDEAQSAVDGLLHAWFAGRPLFVELSPVTDFREACCRQNDIGKLSPCFLLHSKLTFNWVTIGDCNRGGFCNFLHRKKPSEKLVSELSAQQRVQRRLFPSARDVERQKELGLTAPANGAEGGAAGTGTGKWDKPQSSSKSRFDNRDGEDAGAMGPPRSSRHYDDDRGRRRDY